MEAKENNSEQARNFGEEDLEENLWRDKSGSEELKRK